MTGDLPDVLEFAIESDVDDASLPRLLNAFLVQGSSILKMTYGRTRRGAWTLVRVQGLDRMRAQSLQSRLLQIPAVRTVDMSTAPGVGV